MNSTPLLSRTRVFFALLFAVYTLAYPYLGALHNPNEDVRTYLTMALVEDGTVRIDRMVERHGWVNDMARTREADASPGLTSVKAPAVSLLGVPPYAVFVAAARVFGVRPPTAGDGLEARASWLRAATFTLRLVCVQLPCFAFLLGFERYLRRFTADETFRLCAVTAVGLGTNVCAYAHMFTSHALFAAAAFVAFALTRDRRAPLIGGALAGAATLLEYHALPASMALALDAAIAWRAHRVPLPWASRLHRASPRAGAWRMEAPAWLLWMGGALGCAAIMATWHTVAFGTLVTPGHLASANADHAAILSHGFFGIVAPSAYAAMQLAFSRAFGLFGTSPFLVLGLLGAPLALRAHRQAALAALATMAVLFATVASAVNWRGGWTIGPRYLGAAPPFFAWLAVVALERVAARSAFARAGARCLASGLALASVVQTGLVSLLVGALDEPIVRPLPQVVIPFLRAGRFPWNAFDLFGVGVAGGYAVTACALAAAFLVIAPLSSTAPLPPGHAGDRTQAPGASPVGRASAVVIAARWLAAAGVASAIAAVTLVPAMNVPRERAEAAVRARAALEHAWEPVR